MTKTKLGNFLALWVFGAFVCIAVALVTVGAAATPAVQSATVTERYFRFIPYTELAPNDSVSFDVPLNVEFSSQLNPCVGATIARDPITELPPLDQRLEINCRVMDFPTARVWITNKGANPIAIYSRVMIAVTRGA